MKLEEKARVLIVSSVGTASVYDSTLITGGHTTRSFAYTKETSRKWVGGQGWQETQCMPSTYLEQVLEMVSSFLPHLIILKFEENTFELLEAINRTSRGGEMPLIVLTVPKDLWVEEVDACITAPVDPEILLQTVENMLQNELA